MKKTILVTGASRGLGKCLVEEFAKEGYDVIINYNKTNTEEFLKYLKEKYNVNVYSYKCDISNELDVKEMFNKIAIDIGKLDILINNAAICKDNDYRNKDSEEFMDVVKVNLLGTFLVSKYASLMMDDGLIINISSLDAETTYSPLSMDYCASKAGVNSLCKTFSMALENIKVIGVMLPWLNTESVKEMDPIYLKNELIRTKQEKLLDVKDVSKKIIELSSNENVASGSILELGRDLKWIKR